VLVHRRHVDDAAAPALLHHSPRRSLGAEEGGVQVDVERVHPVVPRELEKGSVAARAGVVDEDLDAAERLRELVDHVGGRGKLGEVEPPHLRAPPLRFDLARGVPRAVLVLVPGDADVVAGARELHGRRLADAGVGAGDDRCGHPARISARGAHETDYVWASACASAGRRKPRPT
jgi:hypothetical protein